MNNELCFELENKQLFLECILVEYSSVPIFFVCKEKVDDSYYICLCTDFDEYKYIVTQIDKKNLYKLLHGEIPMRDSILLSTEFWDVISGDDISSDIVQKYSIDDIDMMVLPEEDACFEILTKDLAEYVNDFDRRYKNHRDNEFNITNNIYINLMYNEQVNKFTDNNVVLDKKVMYENDKFYIKKENRIITEKIFQEIVCIEVSLSNRVLAA